MSDLVEKVNDGNFERVVLHSSGQAVSSWQLIFQQSKANNGAYYGDRLSAQNWDWPQETWFQKRLRISEEATAATPKNTPLRSYSSANRFVPEKPKKT
jgi:hypothetical protein